MASLDDEDEQPLVPCDDAKDREMKPFQYEITPEKLVIPMNDSLEITMKPINKDMIPQKYLISLNSYLFEILDARGRKDCITQLYSVSKTGEKLKFRIGLRDKEKSTPDFVHCSPETAEGELYIGHSDCDNDDDSKQNWAWRFKTSKIIWNVQNGDNTAASKKFDLFVEDETSEEIKNRRKKFKEDEPIMKKKKEEWEEKHKKKEETIKKVEKSEKKQKTKDKSDDKTQSADTEEQKKKEVPELPKASEKPTKSPEKPEEKPASKIEPKVKSEKKSVKDRKPNPNRSVIQTSNYPKSAYENLGPISSIPEGPKMSLPEKNATEKTSVKVEMKKEKKKEKNRCCLIL